MQLVDLLQSQHTVLSTPGLVIWRARESFWKIRWLAKEGASVSVDTFLAVWVEVLAHWVGEWVAGPRHKEVWVEVLTALRALMDRRKAASTQQGPQHPAPPNSDSNQSDPPVAWVKQKRETVRARLVSGVSQHITDLVCDSVLLIYSDGSSKRTHVHMAP